MTGVQVPSDPAPNGYVPNPYTSQIDAALAYFHTEKESTEDTKDGIIMEKKFVTGDSSAIPVVRGHGLVKDMTPAVLLSTICQSSARHHWDSRFASGGLLERYSRRTYKFYSVQHGVGIFVSERDIVGVQSVVLLDGDVEKGFEVVQTSVEVVDQVLTTVNPNGSIPTSVVSRIVQDIPLAIVNITNFIRSSGCPPYISGSSISSQLRTEHFNLEAKTHNIKFIAGDEDEDITVVVDPKPFGGNWKVEVSGQGVSAEKKDEGAVVHVPAGSGQFEVNITAA
ncbi:hypothetical protein FRC10_010140 [Ceratobasidium sp. 414]|nr:hypothetical protein FRC10_010140 [Ceratobasidium sp. 414]